MRDRFHWARLLAFVSGSSIKELLLRNEYLAAENRILRAHLSTRLRLSDAERSTLAEIAKRLGGKALKDIARVARPDALLAWYRRLVAQKFDGSRHRAYPGRPRVSPEVEALVVALGAKTVAGDMTGLRARWRIWAIRFRIERSATSSVGTISLQRPRGVARRPGRWRC
jgi:hypothetical protein